MTNWPVEAEHVDPAVLASWMDKHQLGEGPLVGLRLLTGGTQNTLLLFERSGREYVLRRPPQHKRANSDETMRREARVLRALAGSAVPHPGWIASCDDVDVIGAAFYLMEPVVGFNLSEGCPETLDTPESRRAMGLSLIDGLAELGKLDHTQLGLAGFGKPEGYLERQVPRWRSQLESYVSFEGYPGPGFDGLDELGVWLEANLPASFQVGVIHGDFHIANVMFAEGPPRLAAMVDWELSTIGAPLLDLAWLLATSPLHDTEGFPSSDEFVSRYAERSGLDVDDLTWYRVLAGYKLGIILEGSHARAAAGRMPMEVGEALHATALRLFADAATLISP